jgi:hypothetical protein
MKSILWIKNVGPLYSALPKKSWPMMKRSLGQKNCFCYFRYFWKVWNKSQGYVCWKCKKVENQPTLLYIYIVGRNLIEYTDISLSANLVFQWVCFSGNVLQYISSRSKHGKVFSSGYMLPNTTVFYYYLVIILFVARLSLKQNRLLMLKTWVYVRNDAQFCIHIITLSHDLHYYWNTYRKNPLKFRFRPSLLWS